MNRILSILIACALLVGCTTTGEVKPQAITATKMAAFVGTSEYLRQNPASRPAFVRAVMQLEAYETSERFDAATLLAIAQSLPVKELKSPQAAIYITAATILLSDYANEIPIDKLSNLKPVAAAMREGIQLGLSSH